MNQPEFDYEGLAKALRVDLEQLLEAARTLCKLRNREPTPEHIRKACEDIAEYPNIRAALSPVDLDDWPMDEWPPKKDEA